MSVLAPSAVGAVERTSPSWLARLFSSSIGQKVIMAVTGAALSLFVLGHMAGNLNAFRSAEAMDAYGAALRKIPALLWGARIGLLVAVGLHIWSYLALTRKSWAARPQGYRATAYKEASYASRTMRLTGPLLAAFVVYHILHLTTGTVHAQFEEGHVYHNLVTGLRVVPVAIFYLVAMLALGLHLFHGVWSLSQSLGVSQPRHQSFARKLATVFTVIVVGGFALIPLAVLARFLK